jgi:hypothetical protein
VARAIVFTLKLATEIRLRLSALLRSANRSHSNPQCCGKNGYLSKERDKEFHNINEARYLFVRRNAPLRLRSATFPPHPSVPTQYPLLAGKKTESQRTPSRIVRHSLTNRHRLANARMLPESYPSTSRKRRRRRFLVLTGCARTSM